MATAGRALQESGTNTEAPCSVSSVAQRETRVAPVGRKVNLRLLRAARSRLSSTAAKMSRSVPKLQMTATYLLFSESIPISFLWHQQKALWWRRLK